MFQNSLIFPLFTMTLESRFKIQNWCEQKGRLSTGSLKTQQMVSWWNPQRVHHYTGATSQ